jgi:hypothetical protein
MTLNTNDNNSSSNPANMYFEDRFNLVADNIPSLLTLLTLEMNLCTIIVYGFDILQHD